MAIQITTTSSTGYLSDRANAIYPAYVNGIPYVSWSTPPTPDPMLATIANNKKDFFQLKAIGGSTPTYTWNLESGTLPTGLTLANDGTIAGTPTVEGDFTFTVKVTNNGETMTKELTMQSKPYASKWYKEAKFGIIIHWGRISDPRIQLITGDPEFQARITPPVGAFDPDVWANQLAAWGCKILHFSVIWQDSFRNWPSISPTRYELKSSRDIVGELITACHAVGIKVVGYYCVDFQNMPFNITDARLPNNTWGQMNQELILELIDKGLDGLWMDVGAAWETPEVGAVEAWWYPNSAIPRMKYQNPDFIWGINAGVRRGGTHLAYPYADFVIYESVATNSPSATLLETAVPSVSDKIMAIDVSNMIVANFVFGPLGPTQPKKSIDGVKANMLANWEQGATVMIALPVQASGDMRHPNFASYMDELGAFVVANQGYSVTPTISVNSGVGSVNVGTSRARVFYTKDGSIPTKSDFIYLSPIPVNENVILRTRSKESTKPLSLTTDFKLENIASSSSGDTVLFTTIDNDVLAKDITGYYRGMLITIDDTPIKLKRIGRKINSGVTTNHKVVIKRYFDNYPIYAGTIKTTDTTVEGGYQYINITPVRLEAGMTYIVAVQENNTDYYASNTFSAKVSNSSVRVIGPAMLSVQGDANPIVQDNIGQFINLQYEILTYEKSADLALGKPAVFLSNTSGNQLGPSGIQYAVNATDGNLVSTAQGGGEYAYTLRVDLLEITTVSSIRVIFNTEGWATEFNVYASLDGSATNIVGSRVNNNAKNIFFSFTPTAARYILVKALKPNASGQPGGQMSITSLQAYN